MDRLLKNVAGLTLYAISLAVAAVVVHGQGFEVQRPLRFDESVQLAGTAMVAEWVADDLHVELGLGRHESLAVVSMPTQVGDWSVYGIVRSINGLPVLHQDLRLVVDPLHRPVALLGPFTRWDTSSHPASEYHRPLRGVDVPKWLGSDVRLVYWPHQGSLRLSYEAMGVSVASAHRGDRLIVDVDTGSVLARFPFVHSALDREVYDFESACRSTGTRRPMKAGKASRLIARTLQRHLHRNETSRLASNPEIDSLFDLLKDYYDFLKSVLDMDSFDGQGGLMRSVAGVRFHRAKDLVPQCVGNVFNASWIDSQRIAMFPPGVSRFPEFVGHEFGHGLISSGSRLLYQNQSGALNEAIADAIGVTFRAWLATGRRLDSSLPPDIWRIRVGSGVLRDIQNPRRAHNLPNHYSDYRFMRKQDHGGVHTNSSIINQSFYLLASGGRHPDYPGGPRVSGIGLAKAINVFARAGFNMLTPSADFRSARYAFAQVAEVLYGRASPEWVAVHTAMDAVGIPGGWEIPLQPSTTTPTSTIETDQATQPEVGSHGESAQDAPTPTKNADQSAPPKETSDEELPNPEVPTEEPERLPPPVSEVEPDEVPEQPTPTSTDDIDPQTPPTDIVKAEPPTSPEVPRKQAPRFPAPTSDVGPDKQAEPRKPTQTRNPDPPIPPTDSAEQEPTSPDVVGEDTAWLPVLVSLALLLALLIALLLAHSKLRGPKDVAPGTSNGLDYRIPQGGAQPMSSSRSMGVLRSTDGRMTIPLIRNALESPEGLVIGRSSEVCHIQVPDSKVSRRHVRCRRVRGVLWIEDLNSTGGTRVGQIPVKPFVPVEMPAGEVLAIAGHEFKLLPATDPYSKS